MLDIYVDGDACPVKDEVVRVAHRHGLTVYIVSNGGLRPVREPNVHMIIVSDGADAADDWIAQRIGNEDIAITADILLASRCLKNKSHVISPTGKPFTDNNIGSAIASRSISAHLRELGNTTTHHASFSKHDRSRFLQSLEQAIQQIKNSR